LSSRIAFRKYAESVRKGKILLFPTDTVAGIGCRFDSAESVSRLRKLKGLTEVSPIAVLIASLDQLEAIEIRKSPLAMLLMEKFWPGGLTLILSSEKKYPCSGPGNTIGLRMPDSDDLRKIMETAGLPLAASSANVHGRPTPSGLKAVERAIVRKVDLTVNTPVRSSGLASTVVGLEAGELRIIREGAIAAREIYDTISEEI
jgi:L-threonylcarbamoyladenylate synthase